jgi:gamma-glutamylcyclotransferase (GGCT)/AIG2-like uncharacterized protein YtfP
MHIFTYGSLMYEQVWSRVVRACYRSASARLTGYRRCKVRGETYPCLVPGKGTVEGRLYFDVNTNDLQRLDRFEGPGYDRVERFCYVEGGLYIPAGVYVWKEEYRYLVDPAPWLVRHFERDGLKRFLAAYGGFARV